MRFLILALSGQGLLYLFGADVLSAWPFLMAQVLILAIAWTLGRGNEPSEEGGGLLGLLLAGGGVIILLYGIFGMLSGVQSTDMAIAGELVSVPYNSTMGKILYLCAIMTGGSMLGMSVILFRNSR